MVFKCTFEKFVAQGHDASFAAGQKSQRPNYPT